MATVERHREPRILSHHLEAATPRCHRERPEAGAGAAPRNLHGPSRALLDAVSRLPGRGIFRVALALALVAVDFRQCRYCRGEVALGVGDEGVPALQLQGPDLAQEQGLQFGQRAPLNLEFFQAPQGVPQLCNRRGALEVQRCQGRQ